MTENYINISSPSVAKSNDTVNLGKDPFAQPWEELKKFRNVNSNFKRSVTRKAVNINTAGYEESSMMNPAGIGSQSKQINQGKINYVNGYGAFDVITPPYNLYVLSGFYDTSFANHAAIDAKVLSSVGTGYTFNLTNKAMQKLQEEADKNNQDKASKKMDRIKVKATDWLESLNDQDAFTDTMRKVITDFEATGNGYLEIGRTTQGNIGYVGHIPSTTMRVRRLKDGYVQIIGNKIIYFRNFGATNIDPIGNDPTPNEIIHFKKYSPLNTYYGVPDIVSAATSVVGDQQAEQYNLEYFENKAVPRYIVSLKGATLSKESEDKLFRFLQTNLKGSSHRTLFIPLPPDSDGNKVEFKMEPIENEIQDSSFDNYRKTNRQNILLAHQVPLSKLGIAENSGVAAAVTQDRTFRDQVIRPLQKYIEKTVNLIIKEVSELVELRFNEASVVDENIQSQIHERYLAANVLMPNEIREAIGKPQIRGLDPNFSVNSSSDNQTDAMSTGVNRDARDRQRDTNASDSPVTATGRNPKGSGSKENGNIV